MEGRDYLISKYDMRLVLESLVEKFTKQVDTLPAEALSAEREADTLASLEKEHTVYPLVLSPDKITIDQQESQVDVRHDPMRFVIDRSQPVLVPGFTVTYFVPYTSDKWLWETRAGQFTFNPPSARVADSEIVLEYTRSGNLTGLLLRDPPRSWDITYLRSALRGQFYYLYLVVDVWSRKIVGVAQQGFQLLVRRYNPMLWIGKRKERILRCSPTKMNTRKEYAHGETKG